MMPPDDPPSRQAPVNFARRLRREMTVPERRLRFALRDRRLRHWRFRRQVPIGPFVVDFFCHTSGLVIEVDGRSHDDRGEDGRARQAWLSGRGCRAIKFANEDVLSQLDDVCLASLDAPTLTRPPATLSRGERE